MRINRTTVLVGRRSVLVPYRKQHVPRYHDWMKDPLIQQQTASEPLSLQEEYEMQQSWAVDEDKLTFIILARPEADTIGSEVQQDTSDFVSKCTMVGDVNIFFNARHESDDDEEGPTALAARQEPPSASVFDAECEIMIAEQTYRRKGIAREALKMMFEYVTTAPTPSAASQPAHPSADPSPHCTLPIPAEWLTCKISLTNDASIQLFQSLGFIQQKVSEVWQEVEMRLTDATRVLPGQVSDVAIQRVLFWEDH